MTDQPLKRRVAGSIAWTGLRFVSDAVFNFVIFAILARLLAPDDFGTFTVGFIFAEVGKVFSQTGLVSTLFRAETLTPSLKDTVFWANLAVGTVFALACIGFAQAGGDAIGDQRLVPLIAWLGCLVPVSALGATHIALSLRDFGHKSLAVRSLIAGLVGGGLAVWAALDGWGLWSLVIYRYATETIYTLVAWWSYRWLPGRDFSFATLGNLLSLSSSIVAARLMFLALSRSQDVILARMLGFGAVGLYRTAWRPVELVLQGAVVPFVTAALPSLTRLQSDREAFARGYLKLVGACAIVSYPALAGLGALADQVIPLAFGDQWGESIPIAMILAFLVVPLSLDFMADPALTVLGGARQLFIISMAQFLGTVLFFIAAAPFGLIAVTIAYVVRAYLTLALQLWLFRRISGITAAAVLRTIAAPALASAFMAALLIAADWATQDLRNGQPVSLRISTLAGFVAAGAAIYAPTLMLLLGRQGRLALFADLKSVLGRRVALS